MALSLAVLAAVTLSDCGPDLAKAPNAFVLPSPAGADEPAKRSELRTFYQQKLSWRQCGHELRCATLSVPMDYAAPQNGRTFTLPVVMRPATDRAKRLGSLVFDPGGPGASGVDLLKHDGVSSFGTAAQAHFDLVGFDPRGVAGSTPAISCDGPEQPADGNAPGAGAPAPLYPRTAAERAAALADADRTAAACRAAGGDLLRHVGTLDAARDLDVLRAALGDDKLTYLGWSYGTYLGAVYAEQFPRRVRALVLDGAVDPSLDWADRSLNQAKGFQRAVDDYAEHCTTVVGRACPAATPDGIRRVVTDLYARITRHPMRIKGSTDRLDVAGLHTAVTMSMYAPESQWRPLSEALAAAHRGDGGKLAALAHPDLGRQDGDGSPGDAGAAGDAAPDNSDAVLTAVNCLDIPHPGDPQAYWDTLDRAYRTAGLFGADAVVGELACRNWPVGPLTPHRISPPGLPPVLVVGTTGDPATPYEEAQSLAAQLPGGMLLTFRGSGHTAYGRSNACVTDAVDAYLVALRPVPAGTAC